MMECLSLWRSPLDLVALSLAKSRGDGQPRCSIALDEDFHLMTIFNYWYYLSQPSATPSSALTAMFNAMNPGPYGGVGGLAFIAQETLPLPGTVTASAAGFAVPDQCNLVGSGPGGAGEAGGTPYYHFTIDYTIPDSLFLSCTGDYTAGGKYFRSLAFFGTNVSDTGDTASSREPGTAAPLTAHSPISQPLSTLKGPGVRWSSAPSITMECPGQQQSRSRPLSLRGRNAK